MIMRSLISALAVGSVLQVLMVIAGHQVPAVKDYFAPGGMLFSLVAGFVYARSAGSGWNDVLIGGVLAGGLCALIGIGISVALKDVPATLLLMGTAGSAVAGAVGAAIAKAIG